MGLSIFSISSWFSLERLYLSKNLSILLVLVACSSFLWSFVFLEKAMATHSSVLAWRFPGMGEAWWTAVYEVAQSRTRLKRLSSSSTYLYDSPSRTVVCWPSVKALTQLGSYQVRYPQWNDRPRVPCEPFWHLGQEGDDSDTHMCFFPRRCTSARSSTC